MSPSTASPGDRTAAEVAAAIRVDARTWDLTVASGRARPPGGGPDRPARGLRARGRAYLAGVPAARAARGPHRLEPADGGRGAHRGRRAHPRHAGLRPRGPVQPLARRCRLRDLPTARTRRAAAPRPPGLRGTGGGRCPDRRPRRDGPRRPPPGRLPRRRLLQRRPGHRLRRGARRPRRPPAPREPVPRVAVGRSRRPPGHLAEPSTPRRAPEGCAARHWTCPAEAVPPPSRAARTAAGGAGEHPVAGRACLRHRAGAPAHCGDDALLRGRPARMDVAGDGSSPRYGRCSPVRSGCRGPLPPRTDETTSRRADEPTKG